MLIPRARLQFRNRAVTRALPRTRTSFVVACAALVASLFASPAGAQGAPRPEALVKWRQAAFQVIGWNAGRLKNALAPHGPYDAVEVRRAADALAALASAGLADLFPPGTGAARGWRVTTASAAVFSEAAKFRALCEEFARDTAELARLAAGGDRNALGAQFAKVARGCKGCHDRFRETD
jgi:cytochrome c556